MTNTAASQTVNFCRSVLRWLRASYPEGVPGPNRVPLLRSTPLTEEQIAEVVREITKDGSPAIADGVINRDEIAEFISGMTHYDAGPENIIRSPPGWPPPAGRWPVSTSAR